MTISNRILSNDHAITSDHLLPNSLWANTADTPPLTTQLSQSLQAEYLIIGGGYTGLSSALHLAEQGKSVIVLEATDIGFGGSGRNVGYVNASLWLNPDKVESCIGKDKGLQLFNTLVEGPEYVFSLIKKHQINCEATRNGTFHMASSRLGFKSLQSRADMLTKRGERVELISKDECIKRSGIQSYHGAIFHPDAGTIQPLSYARGLAKAAQSAGVKIFTQSSVNSLSPKANGEWEAQCSHGSVTAEKVILATNGYTGDLWPGLKNSFIPVNFFQLATKPLSPDLLENILPEKQGCWDTKLVMTSIRRDEAGRVILGSVGKLPEKGSRFLEHWGRSELRKMFPSLAKSMNSSDFWEFGWVGNIACSDDHIPHIHELAPNLITCLGYSGRGIAPGTLMGKVLAQYMLEDDPKALPVPVSKCQPVPLRNVKDSYYQFGSNAFHLFEQIL